MMLAEHSRQPTIDSTSTNMDRMVNYDEENHALSVTIHDQTNSITPIKIPLVSFAPILATSPNFILVNEFTKRRNQLILLDQHLQPLNIRFASKEKPLHAIWYDKQQCFFILTSNNVFAFDPMSKQLEIIKEILPMENQSFKSFTLLNPSTLLIIYDQWSGEYLDQWQQDDQERWVLIQRQSLGLTSNEFIGDIIIDVEDKCINLVMTIYNILTEQWRLELRNAETLAYEKGILLSGSNLVHDYRLIPMRTIQSDINWLVFSTGNSDLVTIDSEWKKSRLNYRTPIQRLALFNENYLIIRTTDRIDIHPIF